MRLNFGSTRRETKARIRRQRLNEELDNWKNYVKEKLPNAQVCYFIQNMDGDRGHVIVLKPLNEDGTDKFELFRKEIPEGIYMISKRRESSRMAWKSAYLELKKYEAGEKDDLIFKEFSR